MKITSSYLPQFPHLPRQSGDEMYTYQWQVTTYRERCSSLT